MFQPCFNILPVSLQIRQINRLRHDIRDLLIHLFLGSFLQIHEISRWHFLLRHLEFLDEVLLLWGFGFRHDEELLGLLRGFLFWSLLNELSYNFFLNYFGWDLELDLRLPHRLFNFLLGLGRPSHAGIDNLHKSINLNDEILQLTGVSILLVNESLDVLWYFLEEVSHARLLCAKPEYLLDGLDHFINLEVLELVLFEAGDLEGIVEFLFDETAVCLHVDQQRACRLLVHLI